MIVTIISVVAIYIFAHFVFPSLWEDFIGMVTDQVEERQRIRRMYQDLPSDTDDI